MTEPEALFTQLTESGVKLALDGEEFRARTPRGVLTVEVRAAIAAHKPALIHLVAAGASLSESEWLGEMRAAFVPEIHEPPPRCIARAACACLGPCARHECGRSCDVGYEYRQVETACTSDNLSQQSSPIGKIVKEDEEVG